MKFTCSLLGLSLLLCALLTQPVYAGAKSSESFQQLNSQISELMAPDKALILIERASVSSKSWSVAERGRYLLLLASWQEKKNLVAQAMRNYDQSISLLAQLEVSEALINAYIQRAFIKYATGAASKIYCQDREMALSYARQLDQPEPLVKAISALAFCFNNNKGFSKGLKLLNEALEIASKGNLSANRRALIYNSTASIYANNQLYEQATVYLEKAYELWKTVDERSDMFNMKQSLVAIYIRLGLWEKAQANVDELFLLAQTSSQYPDFLFFAHYSAGQLSSKLNNDQLAAEHFEKAEQLKESTSEILYVRNVYALLAISYFNLNKVNQATKAAKKFIQLQPRKKDFENQLIAESIIGLSRGEHKQAIDNLLKIIDYKDDKHLTFVKNATLANSQQYDAKVSEYENALLEKQLAINQLTLNQLKDKQRIADQTVTISGLVAFVLLIIIVLLFLSRKSFKMRSQTDYLTQIANRSYAFESGEKLLNKTIRSGKPFSLIIFDIDKFKNINDTFGHDIGDKAIKATANQAKHLVGKNDLLARIGGEEFLLILPDTTEERAFEIAERLRKGLAAKTFNFGEISINLSISLGVASYLGAKTELDKLVISADQALYAAKESGRNKTEVFQPV